MYQKIHSLYVDIFLSFSFFLAIEGTLGLMNRKNITPGTLVEGAVSSTDISSDEINQLKAQMQDMQLEIDILKETINVLKKDPDIDQR